MAPGKSGKVSKPRGWEEITRKDELRPVRRAGGCAVDGHGAHHYNKDMRRSTAAQTTQTHTKETNMKKRAFLALALMASLLLGGCGGNTTQE